MKVEELLSARNIWFERIEHRPVYTASELASEIHVRGDEVGKTVLLRTNRGFLIAVLSANHIVDLEQVGALLGEPVVKLATREDAATLFTDVEPGVVPPFGAVYGIRSVLDVHLVCLRFVVFEGESFGVAIRMKTDDYIMLTEPYIGLIVANASMSHDRASCASKVQQAKRRREVAGETAHCDRGCHRDDDQDNEFDNSKRSRAARCSGSTG